jgi:hypothetical protein
MRYGGMIWNNESEGMCEETVAETPVSATVMSGCTAYVCENFTKDGQCVSRRQVVVHLALNILV